MYYVLFMYTFKNLFILVGKLSCFNIATVTIKLCCKTIWMNSADAQLFEIL